MTTQEKIALRNKARRDFEGRTYEGDLICQVLVSELKVSNTILIEFLNFESRYLNNFTLEDYDKVLSQCEKPFPKDGFSIRLKDDEIFKGVYNLCKYISLHLGCSMSVLNENVNTEKTLYPEVTLEEIKKEAIRIIKTI